VSRLAPSLACPAGLPAEPGRQPLSLESLYREHFKSVWRVLLRLGVPRAQLDDAAQDVFLVVHRKLDAVEPDSRVRSWVYAIAVRVASEYRRRAGRRRTEPLDEDIADGAAGPARQSELREALRLLAQLLESLDEDRRVVFVLSELEQMSVPEIAQVLGVNPNTVYSRLRSARKAFEAALARRRAAGPRGGGR
jgi:RNA polymerase sigma-70 factor (ECF subfamily)